MAWTFRNGKLLFKNGKAVVNDNCCCGTCVDDCDDSSVSVTLPAFTYPGAPSECPDCADIPAGPYTLDSATAPEAYTGCCYWEKTSGFTATDDCTITKIFVALCIADGDAVITVHVEFATGTIHVFTKTYPVCDFCELVPGSVDVDSAATGECETAGVASVVFAMGCCHQDCVDCVCQDKCETEVTCEVSFTGDLALIFPDTYTFPAWISCDPEAIGDEVVAYAGSILGATLGGLSVAVYINVQIICDSITTYPSGCGLPVTLASHDFGVWLEGCGYIAGTSGIFGPVDTLICGRCGEAELPDGRNPGSICLTACNPLDWQAEQTINTLWCVAPDPPCEDPPPPAEFDPLQPVAGWSGTIVYRFTEV